MLTLMSKRGFKILLVLLNLLALNAYALAAVTIEETASPTAMSMHHEHVATHGMHHASYVQHDCDMPCCKDKAHQSHPSHHDDCACKAGVCSAMHLQSAPQVSHSYFNNSCKVEVLSTTVLAQNLIQRALRPPIR